MKILTQNRRYIAWLACVAILLNALAPAISHAVAAAQYKATPWAQVCSTSGAKFITLALDQSDNANKKQGDDSGLMNMDHCAYCLSQAHSFVMMGNYGLKLATFNLSYSLPLLFYQAPRTLFVWAASSPRAPPVYF